MASIDTLKGNCTLLFYLVLQVANFIIARCGHWKNDVFAFYETPEPERHGKEGVPGCL